MGTARKRGSNALITGLPHEGSTRGSHKRVARFRQQVCVIHYRTDERGAATLCIQTRAAHSSG
eukprot:6775236-Prymnesium_polylepis.2